MQARAEFTRACANVQKQTLYSDTLLYVLRLCTSVGIAFVDELWTNCECLICMQMQQVLLNPAKIIFAVAPARCAEEATSASLEAATKTVAGDLAYHRPLPFDLAYILTSLLHF